MDNTTSTKRVVKVPVAGILYVGNKEYYLLKHEPVIKDSWQPDNTLMFYAVPVLTQGYSKMDNRLVHGFPRHVVVAGSWHIDYGYNGLEIMIYAYEDIEYVAQQPEPELPADYEVVDPQDGKLYRYNQLPMSLS